MNGKIKKSFVLRFLFNDGQIIICEQNSQHNAQKQAKQWKQTNLLR